MTQLTRAMSSPSRMRKIQSSPTRETRNFWQRDAHTEENRERRSKSKISEINSSRCERRVKKEICRCETEKNQLFETRGRKGKK